MRTWRAGIGALTVLALLTGCGDRADRGGQAAADARRDPSVTISGQDAVVVPTWQPPPVVIEEGTVDATRVEAERALEAGRLFGEDRDALPLLLALRKAVPDDARIADAFDRSVVALVAEGDAAIAAFDDDASALRHVHEVASVARTAAPDDARIRAFLSRVDRLDEVVQINHRGERELQAGRLGEEAPGALNYFREALRRRPGDARANQGIAAVESALIRRAEQAAGQSDFDGAAHWLDAAGRVRPHMPTVADARERVAAVRRLRVGELRDRGIDALRRPGGLPQARRVLSDLLRIAEPGDPAAAELRERIEQVAHYGLFRPGQVFTDALRSGARGPQLVVVPHGAFRMGAAAGEDGSSDAEKPAHYVRFDRGFAMSRTEVTVGEFRRFVEATGYRSRAVRRGHSTVYDERGGNFVRRSGVDWSSDYAGQPARDDMPVLHVSARDAEAYVEWLAQQSGQRYRLPSEAEFEYAVRAGSQGAFAWSTRVPPRRAGNVTGALDASPGGRRWHNAFADYGDGWWGPAPVASFAPNAFGLHDLTGNVSEWVADCWHAGYRRAPANGEPWVNPGCRTRVMRGGSWASAPAQIRSAWRLSLDGDTTNARLGFRVVREL